ncbi:MAG: DNA internalization-related competence protein ComEC/Rec2 [Pseudomonadota bacterium]
MKQKPYFRPVIPILFSLILGISIGDFRPGHFELALALGIFAFGAIFVSMGKGALFSPIILFISLGYLSIQPWVSPRFPSHHITEFFGPAAYKIIGVVESEPKETDDKTIVVLEAVCIRPMDGDSDDFKSTHGKIRTTIRGEPKEIHPGDTVSIVTKIRPPKNFNNPGGFNYGRYLSFEGIWATAYLYSERMVVLARSPKKGIMPGVGSLRREISDRIDQLDLQQKDSGAKEILKALLIGYRSEIPSDLREAFNRTGTSHILAISGLHVGIVAGGAFFIFSWVLSRFRFLLWHAWTKKGAALVTLFPVLLYGLLAGMSPSTQRAVIMVAVFLLAFFFQREQDILNTLAVAALIILIIHPPSLFSISFQLSFSAVFFIIYGLSKTKRLLKWESDSSGKEMVSRIRRNLTTSFLVSFFATLGTQPLIMYYFNQLSLVGLAANMVVIPIIGFLAVPLGLLSVFLYSVSQWASFVCLEFSAAILVKGIDVVMFFSKWHFAAVKTITPSHFEMLCFYLAIWAAFEMKSPVNLYFANHLSFFNTDSVLSRIVSQLKGPFRKGRIAILLMIVVTSGLCVDILYWVNHRLWHDDLRVTVIDVGQGNAVLLELPKGETLLIDGGGFADNSIFDVGARVIAPFLWRKKMTTVDTLILSHPNSDHLNGLIQIASHFHVKRVWTNGDESDSYAYRDFIHTVEKKGIAMPEFQDIPRFQEVNGVILEILYPPCDYREKREAERWRKDNNNSLVVKARFGSHTFLFPGDIMAKAEKEMVGMEGERFRSMLMISPHHGSNSSNTDIFLDAVDPQFIIVSTGGRGPHPSVATRYHKRGIQMFCTDTHGAVSISTDGKSLSLLPAVGGSGSSL